MRRFMLMLAAVIAAALAFAGPAPARAAAVASCVSAAQATYTHTLGGTATVSADKPLCSGQSQTFSLVSYTGSSYPLFVYAVTHATLDATHRTATLHVDVPGCQGELDLILGTDVLDELAGGSGTYGNKKLESTTSGDVPCSSAPKVTFASACDGGFSARLSNGDTATADAVFLVGGRSIRVAPGASATVNGPAKGMLTIRDNTSTTHISSWQQPATGCTVAPPPSTAAVTPAVVATTPVATPAAVVPTTSTAPTVIMPSATGPAAQVGLAVNPDAALTASGSHVTSFLFVALGLLLVGGGGVFLTRTVRRARGDS